METLHGTDGSDVQEAKSKHYDVILRMKMQGMPNEFSAVYQLSCLIYWINMTYHLRHLLQHHFGHLYSPDLGGRHSLEANASEVLEQQGQHIHLMDLEAIPISKVIHISIYTKS